ncbi:MAG: SOS response-associated peptidase family protein [Gammaproteobacteria bacterium]|nr:SOS response-associated peptidase family protein [Gammaproteobacteria bacterium]
MCGRFQLKSDKKTKALARSLQVSGALHYADDIAPGAQISIIGKESVIKTATWWLLLDSLSHKPNYKYASFNSRSDKLDQVGSLAYKPFRESRCIIPASAFVEGMGDKKTYHKIELPDKAIAFGGLYKEYLNQETGEIIYSASIITLPPVTKWANIHPKSIPLMLDYENQALTEKWLGPDFNEVAEFNEILQPDIKQTQCVTPIDRPSRWQPVGESFLLS